MIAIDTSVVVAGFGSWHQAHEIAVEALRRHPRIPAHVLLESYSVLTRMPPPHRAPSGIARDFLAIRFPDPPLELPGAEYALLLRDAVRLGIRGGALYDALIAQTAKVAHALLLTRDQRALRTYELVGVDFEVLDQS